MLLEVLLCQVLKVALGEGNGCIDDDGIAIPCHSHRVTKIASLFVDLYFALEEGLKICEHNDVVFNGKLAINDELKVDLLLRLASLFLKNLLAHI